MNNASIRPKKGRNSYSPSRPSTSVSARQHKASVALSAVAGLDEITAAANARLALAVRGATVPWTHALACVAARPAQRQGVCV